MVELGYGCIRGANMMVSDKKMNVTNPEWGQTRAVVPLELLGGTSQEEDTNVEEV